MEIFLLTAIFFPLLFAPCFIFLERIIPRYLGFAAMVAPAVSTVALYFVGSGNGWTSTHSLSLPWVPSLGVSLSFLVDGLSLFFGFLVAVIGVLVCLYSQAIMTHRKKHLGRFYFYLLFFMTTMMGSIFADNLLLLFIFWELTGVASFLLIGFHYEKMKAVEGARMALLVTGLTSLFLLVGIIILGFLGKTYAWSEVVQRLDMLHSRPLWLNVSFLLFAVGIFGKSAQFPFFFWLPRAMVAPTPVSAYLHAATMVKLGIYLTARIYPIFIDTAFWFPVITSFCFTTMLLGAFLSLLSNDLKAILAYATVSQLGFFIGFYGMGGVEGVQYDLVHIFNHALYKGSLFMLVGIVDKATGIRDIRDLGNLWRKMPLTTVIFFIATAAMAGIPGSTGFISKELFLSDLLNFGRANPLGWVILLVVGFASVFKVAFSLRLFLHIFIFPRKEHPHEFFQSPTLLSQISPLVLSGAALYFGLRPASLEVLLGRFYDAGLPLQITHRGEGVPWELVISIVMFSLGIALFLAAEKTNWSWTEIPSFLRFDRVFFQVSHGIQRFAKGLTRLMPQRWDDSLLVYVGVVTLLVGGWVTQNAMPLFEQRQMSAIPFAPLSTLRWGTTFFAAVATVGILFLRGGIGKLVALSTSGFFLTLYFVLYQAPDLAMTQLLVEVATIFFLIFLMKVAADQRHPKKEGLLRYRLKQWIAVAAGVWMAFLCSLVNFHPIQERLGSFFLSESVPLAHGTNAVNAILIDFRGLDTFGEVTVLVLAALGIIGFWKKPKKEAPLIRG